MLIYGCAVLDLFVMFYLLISGCYLWQDVSFAVVLCVLGMIVGDFTSVGACNVWVLLVCWVLFDVCSV